MADQNDTHNEQQSAQTNNTAGQPQAQDDQPMVADENPPEMDMDMGMDQQVAPEEGAQDQQPAQAPPQPQQPQGQAQPDMGQNMGMDGARQTGAQGEEVNANAFFEGSGQQGQPEPSAQSRGQSQPQGQPQAQGQTQSQQTQSQGQAQSQQHQRPAGQERAQQRAEQGRNQQPQQPQGQAQQDQGQQKEPVDTRQQRQNVMSEGGQFPFTYGTAGQTWEFTVYEPQGDAVYDAQDVQAAIPDDYINAMRENVLEYGGLEAYQQAVANGSAEARMPTLTGDGLRSVHGLLMGVMEHHPQDGQQELVGPSLRTWLQQDLPNVLATTLAMRTIQMLPDLRAVEQFRLGDN